MGEQKKDWPSVPGRQSRNKAKLTAEEIIKALDDIKNPVDETHSEVVNDIIPDTSSTEENTMPKPPKVFISYSYDSDEHVEWVENFATQLRGHGVDVMLDKWNFKMGKPSGMQMNQAIADPDRVLCICTDKYITRVNNGEGGAGYEGFLITSELVRNAATEKFIPVIRNAKGSQKAPKCLDGRVRVDLSDGPTYETEYERLLRELHNAVEIPPLGENPFLKKNPPQGLSEEAKKLLKEATKDQNGHILLYKADQGTIFIVNGQEFGSENPRIQAAWENGFQELEDQQLIRAQSSKRIEFKLTKNGYNLADRIHE